MSRTDRHVQIRDRILELLRQEQFRPFKPADVRYEDFPDVKPSIGIVLSPMQESEGIGTNLQDDIRYTFKLTYCVHRTIPKEGLEQKSYFRNRVFEIFHRRRIGQIGNELITIVRHGDFTSTPKMRKHKLDTTYLLITVSVRESRDN